MGENWRGVRDDFRNWVSLASVTQAHG